MLNSSIMPEYQTVRVPIATSGLNKDLQPTQIPASSPNIVNMLVENWGVRKRLGYATLGINLPLPGIGMELIQYIDAVGEIHQIALTTTAAYKYDSDSNQWLNIGDTTVIEDCEDDWVNDNVNTCAAQSSIKKIGTNAILVSITSDIAVGDLLCHEGMSAIDITDEGILTLWIRSNKAISKDSLEIVLSETAAGSDPKTGSDGTNYITLTNPLAMIADTWYSMNIPLTGSDVPTNMNAIIQIALYSNHATELDGDVTETKIYLDDIKVTTGFTGSASNRWSHTVTHDGNEFTNNGGTALVISNNVDKPYYYEGQASGTFELLDVSDFTSFGYTKEVIEFKNHFFALNYNNGSTHVRSLAFTDLADIDNWTSGNSGSTTLTDSKGKLLRAKKLGSDMIIYSENTITTCKYLGGTVLFTFPTLVYETGLLSEKGLWDFVNVHYFIGTDQKLYGYAGGQQLIPIGAAIEDSFFSELNVANKENALLGIDTARHKLHFMFPSSGDTYANKDYVYNYKQNPPTWEYYEFNDTIRDFSVFSNKVGWFADGIELAGTYADELSLYADASFTQNQHHVAVMLSHDGYIFKLDEATGLDNVTTIPCIYETMDLTADAEEHYFRTAWISFNLMSTIISSTYDLHYSTDGGLNWMLIVQDSSISNGVINKWKQHRHPVDVSERKIRFRLTQDSNKDLQIRSGNIKFIVQTDRD